MRQVISAPVIMSNEVKCRVIQAILFPSLGKIHLIAHKGFTITPNVNYKCPRSVAAIALPVAAMALPQPPIYLKPT